MHGAEICGEYLRKGKLISIEGRLQITSYEKNGKTVKSAEVVADNMQMLDRKGDAPAQTAASSTTTATTNPAPQQTAEEVVPF